MLSMISSRMVRDGGTLCLLSVVLVSGQPRVGSRHRLLVYLLSARSCVRMCLRVEFHRHCSWRFLLRSFIVVLKIELRRPQCVFPTFRPSLSVLFFFSSFTRSFSFTLPSLLPTLFHRPFTFFFSRLPVSIHPSWQPSASSSSSLFWRHTSWLPRHQRR